MLINSATVLACSLAQGGLQKLLLLGLKTCKCRPWSATTNCGGNAVAKGQHSGRLRQGRPLLAGQRTCDSDFNLGRKLQRVKCNATCGMWRHPFQAVPTVTGGLTSGRSLLC